VPKTVVILLLEYLLETRGFEGIRLAFRAPAGPELEANQQGENELMPFQVLDACFYLHAAEKLAADEITAALGSMFPMYGAEQLGSWVAKLRRLFAMNIYKWVQAPLSLHVGNLDLERERALQLPVVERNEW
jgi:NAD+ synthase (glutamine-hydrolysing)